MLRYLYSHSGHPGNVKLGHSHSVPPRQAFCVEDDISEYRTDFSGAPQKIIFVNKGKMVTYLIRIS